MRHLFFALATLPALLCCQRYEFERLHAGLHFSADTVSFDTIFAPLGSTTLQCKVYNRGDKNLVVDEIFLAKRSASPFLMNVNGHAGYSVRNIRLARQDSLYIFLEVPRSSTLLLTDQIVLVTGGMEQAARIALVAYGQEVVLWGKDTVLKSSYTFTADKPYLITGSVTIDSGATATVAAGAKLYFGWRCGMVVNGALSVEGHLTAPCVFSHPRHKDPWYGTAGGQWQGITVNAGGSAEVACAQLHGARHAFYVQDTLGRAPGSPQLKLSRSRIAYSEVGIHICSGAAHIDNSLVANSTTHALLLQGGTCTAYHSTFAAYAAAPGYSQVVLQNFRLRGARDTVDAPLKQLHFGNCIVHGSNTGALLLNLRRGHSSSIDFELEDNTQAGDPRFRDVANHDFRLSASSPAINAGRQDIAYDGRYRVDLDGYNRVVEQDSSMGCYAYRP